MNGYLTRALEIHDFTQIWDLEEIKVRLDFMVRNGMNALVFHEPGIEDKIIFPGKFLGAEKTATSYYEQFLQIDHNIFYYALRENLNLNRRAYMKHLIKEAKKAGVDVYFENKELWFADFILKYKPDLVKNGTICPSDPFWWEEFLPAKYEELFLALPDLAGIVVSIGTGESRLAISNTFACGCQRCKDLDPVAWYKNIITAIYGPFKKAGKKLVIRDFIYSKEEQDRFAQAFNSLPDDIVLSLKNTPHDFYPTFPDNPLIGGVENHPQWIEYDVNGQFFGWGSAPSIMIDDIKQRLEYGTNHNVTGFIARTDWEGVQDHTCFDTPNLINLYAIAMLAQNPQTQPKDIYLKWLNDNKLLKPGITPQELKRTIEWIDEIMSKTWPIIRASVYVNGTVFSNDSCIHLSLNQPAFIGETHHSLKDWDPSKADALDTSEVNIMKLMTEKEEACMNSKSLLELVKNENPGLTDNSYSWLLEHFIFMDKYVQAFRHTARAYFFSRYIKENGERAELYGEFAVELLNKEAKIIENFTDELIKMPFMNKYPFDELLDPERFYIFTKNIHNWRV